jgi:pimeloyl-ACP methyl ester carboxylesterase
MQLEDFDAHRAFVQTGSADIGYVDVGEGRPAVFLHGVGTSAYLWRNVIAELAGEARCIALDLPLHGRSAARPDQDFSLGALAEIVAEFCAALGLDDIDLVANDTGGAVAQIFAARHPELLRTFTLTNCDTQDNIPPEPFKATVELAKAGGLAPAAPALLSDLSTARAVVFSPGYEDPGLPTDEVVRANLEPIIGTPESARQFERVLSALEPRDLAAVEPGLKRLTVPTLIVWGTGDQFFDPRWAYWLSDTIPGVTEVIEIDGAKLFFPDERPHDLVPHLRRHWAATPRRRQSTSASA